MAGLAAVGEWRLGGGRGGEEAGGQGAEATAAAREARAASGRGRAASVMAAEAGGAVAAEETAGGPRQRRTARRGQEQEPPQEERLDGVGGTAPARRRLLPRGGGRAGHAEHGAGPVGVRRAAGHGDRGRLARSWNTARGTPSAPSWPRPSWAGSTRFTSSPSPKCCTWCRLGDHRVHVSDIIGPGGLVYLGRVLPPRRPRSRPTWPSGQHHPGHRRCAAPAQVPHAYRHGGRDLRRQ